MFELDPVLKKDTILLARLPLCELLLMNDRQYPWFILVPRHDGLRELIELNIDEREQYTRESNAVAYLLLKAFHAEKLNIAALGNPVAQLHIHHIGRFVRDIAWPKPIWGVCEPQPYSTEKLENLLTLVKTNFKLESPGEVSWL